jgi:hypothetical protein
MPRLSNESGLFFKPRRLYEMGKAMGLGRKDAASIVTLYEHWTGVPVVPRA